MSLHPVVIDDAQIQAVYAKYINAESIEGEYISSSDNEEQQINPDAWKKESEIVVTAICGQVVPAWEIPVENQENLASALSGYLSQKWPNGFLQNKIERMTPGWRALFEIGNTLKYGFDVGNMKFKPRYEEQEKSVSENEESQAETKTQEKPKGGFKTDT